MLLTIGMIVKNESKYLEQCLTAMQPILQNVESELIIADTGSTDNTVEIAKRFTDNVLEIQWENDFSKARNATLRRAKGKWFMYIDADEIFDQSQGLIDFFNKGGYKKSECASVTISNITGKKEATFTTARLFKIKKGQMFEGKIHERAPLKDGKITNIPNVLIKHYGYDFTGQKGSELKEKKTRRNIDLLLEEYKANPKDKDLIYYLMREYRVLGDAENSQKFFDIGMGLIPKNAKDSTFYYTAYTHNAVILNHSLLKDYKKAADILEDYFNTAKTMYVSSILFHHLQGEILQKLNSYTQAAQAFEKGLELYETHMVRPLDMRSTFYIAQETIDTKTKNTLLNGALINYALAGDYEAANALEKLERLDASVFSSTVKELKDDTKAIRNLTDYITQIYGSEVPQDLCVLIALAMEQGQDVDQIIKSINITNTKGMLVTLIRNLPDLKDILLKYLKDNNYLENSTAIKTVRIMYVLSQGLLYLEKNEQTQDELLEAYARTHYRYLMLTHKEEVLTEENITDLDEEVIFGYYAGTAYQNKASGVDFIRNLHKSIKFNSKQKDIIVRIAKHVQEDIEKTSSPNVTNKALEQLKAAMQQQFATLKTSIQGLITENPQQAAGLLAKYEAVNPGDPDIATMKAKLKDYL